MGPTWACSPRRRPWPPRTSKVWTSCRCAPLRTPRCGSCSPRRWSRRHRQRPMWSAWPRSSTSRRAAARGPRGTRAKQPKWYVWPLVLQTTTWPRRRAPSAASSQRGSACASASARRGGRSRRRRRRRSWIASRRRSWTCIPSAKWCVRTRRASPPPSTSCPWAGSRAPPQPGASTPSGNARGARTGDAGHGGLGRRIGRRSAGERIF
mmetsp:Transcript_9409/g.27433  ORF Transcript_9409/g.27433 Transcript_9409/m.27433 type:complete len:208 (-) Transcript_9409:157-780(-)